MKTLLWFVLAAGAEIMGCFCFWMWAREGKSWAWTGLGIVSLICFALTLTRIESDYAGRAFATYGGVYICASLGWLWAYEGARPDRFDILGALVCLLGAAIILFGPRTA
jgi:small multidrug resistance family-3 protein